MRIDGDFVLGDRNAASDVSGSMVINEPTVMILDDSLIRATDWSSVGIRNGLATLIITNNATFTKINRNHFRIGTDGNPSKPSNAYAQGRVHVSTGGTLDIATNELRIAHGTADTGYLTISAGGTVKAHQITGSGKGALTFDGGTLQALRSSSDFITCAVPLLVNAGAAAMIDDSGFEITITKAFGGAGGITKKGSGTLTLAALSTNTGPVTVEAGTLEIPDGAGTGGTLTFVTNATTTVVIGTSDSADTITLGALHLASDFALEVVSPGICDKLILTTATGITAEPGAELLLDYDPADFNALFGDPSVRYTVATTPGSCSNPPVFANLPEGWYIRTGSNGDGTIDHILNSAGGTLLILR
jgi:autotransporter-associated beta strand protein